MNPSRVKFLSYSRTYGRKALVICLLVAGALLIGRQITAHSKSKQIKRGDYLVKVLACNDCHTPWKLGPKGPEPDMSLMLSGHPESLKMPIPPKLSDGAWEWVGAATNTAFAGPWGITYAANLTPDENTGLGIWTEDMFIRAIRLGKHMGQSRTIMPPMPWPAFANLTDEDLKGIYAYLRTIPPVTNHVPDYVYPDEIEP